MDNTYLVPIPEPSTEGNVLMVENGEWQSKTPATGLPSVTAEDNGKVLTVAEGAWTKGEATGGGSLVELSDGLVDTVAGELETLAIALLSGDGTPVKSTIDVSESMGESDYDAFETATTNVGVGKPTLVSFFGIVTSPTTIAYDDSSSTLTLLIPNYGMSGYIIRMTITFSYVRARTGAECTLILELVDATTPASADPS